MYRILKLSSSLTATQEYYSYILNSDGTIYETDDLINLSDKYKELVLTAPQNSIIPIDLLSTEVIVNITDITG